MSGYNGERIMSAQKEGLESLLFCPTGNEKSWMYVILQHQLNSSLFIYSLIQWYAILRQPVSMRHMVQSEAKSWMATTCARLCWNSLVELWYNEMLSQKQCISNSLPLPWSSFQYVQGCGLQPPPNQPYESKYAHHHRPAKRAGPQLQAVQYEVPQRLYGRPCVGNRVL